MSSIDNSKISYSIKRGKPIDSWFLKRDLDKSASILKSKLFSVAISPGQTVERCLACGHEKTVELTKVYGFTYNECVECGSAFVVNPPSEADISAAYRSDYYSDANKVLLANDKIIDSRTEMVARPKVKFVIDNLTTTKKSWLDVGCGVGEILGAVKDHGFTTLGLETNAMEAEFARRKFGVEVREEYVTADTLPRYQNKYGVISLFSVLEHVPHPNDILQTVSRAQMPGDNLVVETPHFPSVSAFSQVCFPEKINRMMHPPLHLFLFSTKAMELMLTRAGYEIISIWYFGQDFYEFFSTLAIMNQSLNNSRLSSVMLEMGSAFQQAIDDKGLSDEMLIVARKL
jgi:2-polyprenyl-3-methyl-5-hydroxy-6-metoxy-1,4-benzoquinol methylase